MLQLLQRSFITSGMVLIIIKPLIWNGHINQNASPPTYDLYVLTANDKHPDLVADDRDYRYATSWLVLDGCGILWLSCADNWQLRVKWTRIDVGAQWSDWITLIDGEVLRPKHLWDQRDPNHVHVLYSTGFSDTKCRFASFELEA